MTAPALSPDATRCPDCRAALAGPRCASCGLPLVGPAARRLWEVDSELLRLDRSRGVLLDERDGLLTALRAGTPRPAASAQARPALPAAPAPREWTPQRVQNLLLGLGGLLLAVAALVFAAVTYDRLGAGGRAAVLLVLTLAAAGAAPTVRARGLAATAETLGAVALVLAACDAYGLRTLGLAQDSDPLLYTAGSAAVLAALSGGYALAVPLRVLQGAAVVLAQLPVPLLLAHADASATTTGFALAALAAVDVAVAAATRGRLTRVSAVALAVSTGVVAAAALLAALAGAFGDRSDAASAALLACAAVLAGAGAGTTDRTWRALLTGAAVPVVGAAAYALTLDEPASGPLVLVAVGLLAALGAAQLPRAWRTGPVVGALAVCAGAVALVAEQTAAGVLLPLTWLADPWTLPAGRGARGALGVGTQWSGTAVPPVVLLGASLAVVAAALALRALRLAAVPAGVLAAAAAVLLPLGLDLPYGAGLGVLLTLGAALAAAGTWSHRSSRTGGLALAASGTGVALHAAAWSTASQGATLAVLPLTALLAAGLAATRLPRPAAPTALAGLLATAWVAALGAADGLAADQVGGLLLVAVAGLLGAALLVDVARRPGAEGAAVVAAAAAVLLASGDVGWLSWTLAGTGLLALATALRSDRRAAAPAGALLLAASSWVRLADAGVTAPEPYALPLAVVALGLGHLRRRQVPGTRSWAAYGPGLALALVPSLLASFDDEALTRPLLLGLAALVVTLAGARLRLQAPLALGGAVLALDALQLLAPYAAALPRWLSLGTAGTLLVVVGATYEQRRRDVARARQRYEALT